MAQKTLKNLSNNVSADFTIKGGEAVTLKNIKKANMKNEAIKERVVVKKIKER